MHIMKETRHITQNKCTWLSSTDNGGLPLQGNLIEHEYTLETGLERNISQHNSSYGLKADLLQCVGTHHVKYDFDFVSDINVTLSLVPSAA